MKRITQDALASLEFELEWSTMTGRHKDIYYADKVNFWRDIFPEEIRRSMMGASPGDRIQFYLRPGEALSDYALGKRFMVNHAQFERRKINDRPLEPRFGRFYPKGLLKGLPNVFSNNVEPFRCVGVEAEGITADFNHPLAGREMALTITVHKVKEKASDRGGRMEEWIDTITAGPGMQARLNGKPTEFFLDDPFARSNEDEDVQFYRKPRLVTHVDDKALEIISGLYGRLLEPGMKVLDLMSSWKSHVPDSLDLESLVGLGLNKEEMENNAQLTDHVVHDLNTMTKLPFDDHTFDAVICTVSVEYMVRPLDVFQDVVRILKPGRRFIHTFSNRWFPPKVASIWQELSEFERMGLVLEYFSASGAYEGLETHSVRGWPRPVGDRYYPDMMTADPVYAVWGQTKS
jgi:FKBP-type peptidyl-prolyl cis-trans isomerase 2